MKNPTLFILLLALLASCSTEKKLSKPSPWDGYAILSAPAGRIPLGSQWQDGTGISITGNTKEIPTKQAESYDFADTSSIKLGIVGSIGNFLGLDVGGSTVSTSAISTGPIYAIHLASLFDLDVRPQTDYVWDALMVKDLSFSTNDEDAARLKAQIDAQNKFKNKGEIEASAGGHSVVHYKSADAYVGLRIMRFGNIEDSTIPLKNTFNAQNPIGSFGSKYDISFDSITEEDRLAFESDEHGVFQERLTCKPNNAACIMTVNFNERYQPGNTQVRWFLPEGRIANRKFFLDACAANDSKLRRDYLQIQNLTLKKNGQGFQISNVGTLEVHSQNLRNSIHHNPVGGGQWSIR